MEKIADNGDDLAKKIDLANSVIAVFSFLPPFLDIIGYKKTSEVLSKGISIASITLGATSGVVKTATVIAKAYVKEQGEFKDKITESLKEGLKEGIKQTFKVSSIILANKLENFISETIDRFNVKNAPQVCEKFGVWLETYAKENPDKYTHNLIAFIAPKVKKNVAHCIQTVIDDYGENIQKQICDFIAYKIIKYIDAGLEYCLEASENVKEYESSKND
ncbi:hypothetical protein EIN_467260 [Entamoeba invadens IP1]|uniref:Uncharacterized protein n=1 Tax=Entamoeba invadens IP1 TaxID=370355 RepID=A0A0A1TUE9_ENTIV|nr:hypothetical protein EIN_467260 [Entamoeba invadens IP1]ELP83662.1 hypothetical protein EIN_467260 [Entamoeba invadens IP1]|eukprot:XP_004183008.1 hypothetical protein EIN_467260 [Entamoeba invadens IP1]